MPEIETFNKFLVGSNGAGIVIMNQAALRAPLSEDDAILLAAYLVSLTVAGRKRFNEVCDAVEST